MKALPQAPALWQLENATVINNAGTDVTALQRNDPDPPSASKKMIRCPFTRGTALICVIGKTLSPLVAVPLLDPAEARPDCVNRVLGVRTKMSEFSGEHGRTTGSVDNPTRADGAFTTIQSGADLLAIVII